jgi:hypothetical protein
MSLVNSFLVNRVRYLSDIRCEFTPNWQRDTENWSIIPKLPITVHFSEADPSVRDVDPPGGISRRATPKGHRI